jgi:hypothetical protein
MLLAPSLLALLPVAQSPATAADRAGALDPARVHALIVGVLEWKDASFSSFS